MSTIASGWLTALFLYDVAEAIDLHRQRPDWSDDRLACWPETACTRLHSVRAPPVTIDGQSLELPRVGDWQVRFKVFDYGVNRWH